MLILRNGSHEKSLKLPDSETLPLIHFLFCKGKVLRKSYLTPFTTIKNDLCKKWLDVDAATYTYQYCSFSWTLFKNYSLKVSGIDKSLDIYNLNQVMCSRIFRTFFLTISQGSVLKFFSLFKHKNIHVNMLSDLITPLGRYGGIISNHSSAAMSYTVH